MLNAMDDQGQYNFALCEKLQKIATKRSHIKRSHIFKRLNFISTFILKSALCCET